MVYQIPTYKLLAVATMTAAAGVSTESAGSTVSFAQAYIFPLPFATINTVVTDSGTCTGTTLTLTSWTVPTSMGAAQTGLCHAPGY